MAKVSDCSFEVYAFELQSRYYIYFRVITPESFLPPVKG